MKKTNSNLFSQHVVTDFFFIHTVTYNTPLFFEMNIISKKEKQQAKKLTKR